jgi:hypothetical protein
VVAEVASFGCSCDGVTFTPTNSPAFTMTNITVAGQGTNGCVILNLSTSTLGAIGFIQLQERQNVGTNTSVNDTFVVVGKSKRSG